MISDSYSEYLRDKSHKNSRDLRIKQKRGLENFEKLEERIFKTYPKLTKVLKLKCLALIFNALPSNIRENILYYYQQGKKLTVIVSSSAYQQEIVYKKALLQSLQKMIKREKPQCGDIEIFEDLKVIVDRKNTKQIFTQKAQKFLEQAEGDFQNLAKNDKIKIKIEEIRNIIKKEEH